MNLYCWRTSRGRHVQDKLRGESMNSEGVVYNGVIISDNYEGYARWMRSRAAEQRPQWQDFWAQVRRKFAVAAHSGSDPECSLKMVKTITPLYRIEKGLRESKAPSETIAKKREAESRSIVDAFFAALHERLKRRENPLLSKLRRVISYKKERRATLITWLKATHITIDNNAVERANRPLAQGRRSSLFNVSTEADRRAAILYTLVRKYERGGGLRSVDDGGRCGETRASKPNFPKARYRLKPRACHPCQGGELVESLIINRASPIFRKNSLISSNIPAKKQQLAFLTILCIPFLISK